MIHDIFSTLFYTLCLTVNHAVGSVRIPFHLGMFQNLIAYFCGYAQNIIQCLQTRRFDPGNGI